MLSNFILDDGQPNPSALLEQAALLSSFWWQSPGQQDNILNLLSGAGSWTIINKQVNATSWPPGWVVYSINGTYVIHIMGTVNLPQWIGHIQGAICPIADDVLGCTINGQWQGAWQSIRGAIRACLPTNIRDTQIKVVGYSYGALIALYIACDLANQGNPAAIQYMSFGGPRGFGFFDPKALPGTILNIQNEYDIVCDLPGSATGIATFNLLQLGFIANPVIWSHKGRIFQLSPQGALTEHQQNWNLYYANPITITTAVQNHFMNSYAAFIMNFFVDKALTQQNAYLILFLTNIIGEQIPVEFVDAIALQVGCPADEVNRFFGNEINLGINNDNIINVQLNTVRGFAEVSGVSHNIGEIGVNIMSTYTTMTLIASDGRNGWTTDVTVNLAGGLNAAQPLAIPYAQLVANCFGTVGGSVAGIGNPSFEYYRLTDPLQPKNTVLAPFNPPIVNQTMRQKQQVLGNPIVGANSGSAWDTVVYRQKGVDANGKIAFRTFEISGMPAAIMQNYNLVPGFQGGTYQTALNTLTTYLFGQNGRAAVPYGFMGQDQTQVKYRIVSSAVVGTSWTINVIGAPPYAQGDVVKLLLTRVKAFANEFTVASVVAGSGATAGQSVVTLVSTPNLPSLTITGPSTGSMQRKFTLTNGVLVPNKSFCAFTTNTTDMVYKGISERRRGRPFVPLEGRGRGSKRK